MKTETQMDRLIAQADKSLAALSDITLRIMAMHSGAKQSLAYATRATPAAAHKERVLIKTTETVVRAGIDYANLASAPEEVKALPYGEWEIFPFTIKHNGERQIRLYPSKENPTRTIYTVDGQTVTKETFASYLQPAKAKELLEGRTKELLCYNVKECNLIG